MYKFIFTAVVFVSVSSLAQDAVVYKEKETCHTYSEFITYKDSGEGKFDIKPLKKQKVNTEYQRTIITKDSNITTYEESQRYNEEGMMTEGHSNYYQTKRIKLDENTYKYKSVYNSILYIPGHDDRTITKKALQKTEIYRVYPNGSRKLLQYTTDDGKTHEAFKNFEYTTPKGITHTVTISNTKTTTGEYLWKKDTLFQMTVCESKRL